MNSPFPLFLAKLLKLQFWSTFCHTYTRAIIPVAALCALKPDILSFAFLFSHKIRPHQAGSILYETTFVYLNMPARMIVASVYKLVSTAVSSSDIFYI
jgi:hypothetical protein